jgi:hypothetical protein
MNENSALYQFGKKMGHLISELQNSLADKKITMLEAAGIGGDVIAFGMGAFQSRSELKEDIADGLSDEEQVDLRGGFNEGYEIASDATEATVEKAFAIVLSTADWMADMFIKKPASETAQEQSPTV